MNREICPGQIYKHFKNKLYQILAVAKHSETGEQLVIYQQLYGDFEVYARPLDMFMSEVDHVKYPEVSQTYRFELIGDKKFSVSVKNNGINENETIEKINKSVYKIDKDVIASDITKSNASVTPEAVKSNAPVTSESVQSNASVTPEVVQSNASVNSGAANDDNAENSEEINPVLLMFLDAVTYEDKHNVLMRNRDNMTDRLINDLAMSMDVTVDEGELDARFDSLLSCVDMMAKFEVNR